MSDLPSAASAAPPDDPLGAFCRDNHAALAGAGNGPLAGLSFAAKDVFHVAGHRTGFGHPDWLRTHPPAGETAAAVQRLLGAGATMVGRTLTDELAYSLSGENPHYGTPVNPRAPDRIPGGSSNGSVSAVAGGLVDFALGTDCGGLRAAAGQLLRRLRHAPDPRPRSGGGCDPLRPELRRGGMVRPRRRHDGAGRPGPARRRCGAPPARRLLVVRDAFALVDPAVSAALGEAVDTVAKTVGASGETTLSPAGLPAWFETFRVLQAAEIWGNHGAWIRATRPAFGPGVRDRLDWASKVTPERVAAAKAGHAAIRSRLTELLQPGDVLCLPTSPRVAPLRNTPTDDLEIRFRHQAMCLLCIAGLGGLPQISLPLATFDGLPLGLSLVGPRDSDAALLDLAQRVAAPT